MDEIYQSKTKLQKQTAQIAFTFPLWFPILKAVFTCFVNGMSFMTTVSQLNIKKKSEAGFIFFTMSFVLMNIFRAVSIGKTFQEILLLFADFSQIFSRNHSFFESVVQQECKLFLKLGELLFSIASMQTISSRTSINSKLADVLRTTNFYIKL